MMGGWIPVRWRRSLAKRLDKVARRLNPPSNEPPPAAPLPDRPRIDKATQLLLANQYRQFLHLGLPLPSLEEAAFRVYSQNGEDGVLHLIFTVIGTTNRKCVEICAEDGTECNTANLIINYGWQGLLFDGSEQNVQRGREFYKSLRNNWNFSPKFQQAWITAENIDGLIRDNGFTGEIDLLSIDIDGNDYWVWEAIQCITPRVVIIEYQKALGADAVAQKYDPQHVGHFGNVDGSSLGAFAKLARRKGYRLVATHRCLNAIFMLNGVGEEYFPEVPVESGLQHPMAKFCMARYQNELSSKLADKFVAV